MTFIDLRQKWVMAPRRFVLGFRRQFAAQLAAQLTHEHATTKKLAGSAFVIRIASAGIVFVSQVLIARWMGSYEFGAYVYVSTALLLVTELVHYSLPLTAQRFIPEYTQEGSFDLLRGFLSGSRWLVFAFGTGVALLGALIIYALGPRVDAHLIWPYYFAFAALPFFALTVMSDGIARAYNWIDVALLPPYIVRPLTFIVSVAALYAVHMPLNTTTVMAALAVTGWFVALLQVVQLDRKLKVATPPGPKRYEVKRWLGVASPIIFGWGFYTLLLSIDVLLLKQFNSEEVVAHYYAAGKVLAPVSIIIFAVAAAAGHRYTDYKVADDREGLATFAGSTVRWVFWPSLALTLMIVALGRPLLSLFGPAFVAGYPVMVILAIGQMARAAVGPAERMLNMLGQQRACAFAYAAVFAFDLAACLLLTPIYGAIGAAIATAATFVLESVLLFAIAKRKLGLHLFIWQFPRKAAPRATLTAN
ncbi:MAG TPA: lipopolysaccharide biosynthesis protein [Pseudolabrys sp.]|nr:lipopolysaccharide biosynthesis protein [Pseudolabrys sp.]